MTQAITPLVMPKFGLSMTEGTVTSWTVSVGKEVKTGQPLVDIETSKITNEYESPADGILRRQIALNGDTLPVGALIGILAENAVNDAEIDSFIANFHNEQNTEAESDEAEGSSAAKKGQQEKSDRIIEIESCPIHIRELGKPLDPGAHQTGNALPVLLIHGFGGSMNDWISNEDALGADRHIIMLDLPGHGSSDKNVADGSMRGLAQLVQKLMTELNLPKFHVIGHSLGGGIALSLLRDVPEKLASVSLLAPAGLGQTINAQYMGDFIKAATVRALQKTMETLVYNKSLIIRPKAELAMREKRIDGVRAAQQTINDANFTSDGKQRLSLQDVLVQNAAKGEHSVPVLLIWGENDEILSASEIGPLPGGVMLHMLPKTGHVPQVEQFRPVNALIVPFLKEADTRS